MLDILAVRLSGIEARQHPGDDGCKGGGGERGRLLQPRLWSPCFEQGGRERLRAIGWGPYWHCAVDWGGDGGR